jgi:hypothetical protein
MPALPRLALVCVAVSGLGCGCTGSESQTMEATCMSYISWSGRVATYADELEARACLNDECVELAILVEPTPQECPIFRTYSGTGWYVDRSACRDGLDGSPESEVVQLSVALGAGDPDPPEDVSARWKDGDLATLVVRAEGIPILTAEQPVNFHTYTVDGKVCKNAEVHLE